MTREDVSRTLRYMEHLRESSYEASPRKAKQMDAEYGRLWESIRPYVEGKIPYSESKPSEVEGDRAAWASRR